MEPDTQYDAFIKRLKNHKIVAVMLVAFVVVVGLATLTQSVQNLWRVVSPVVSRPADRPAPSSSAGIPPSAQSQPLTQPRRAQENPLCRYVLFTRTRVDETRGRYIFDGARHSRDDRDMRRPFVLVLKNYDIGSYDLWISFDTVKDGVDPKPVGAWKIQAHLTDKQYYIVRQDNTDMSMPPRFESPSDNEVTRFRAQAGINMPDCYRVSPGPTWPF